MADIVRVGIVFVSLLIRKKLQERLNQKKRKARRMWVRNWISKRDTHGASNILLRQLKDEDPVAYRNVLRMSNEQFNVLLQMVDETIRKKDTKMRMAIPTATKLEITLRFLATGDSFKSLEYLFRVPECTISLFVSEVLAAICQVLKPYIKMPSTSNEWKQIQYNFFLRWNFPRCCGAIDGKHVLIKKPPKSGSMYFNYKKTYSIVLFAMVDADYCFTYIDIGANGRASDSAIFRDSTLNIAMQNNTLNMPENSIIVGDDAFPLRTKLMKPYSKSQLNNTERIFNYRLSRARRVSENAFGILVWRFRIFSRPIQLKETTIDNVILAACSLHNWLKKSNPNTYFPENAVDREDLNTGNITFGQWRNHVNNLPTVSHLGSNNYKNSAEEVRRKYAKYFMEDNPLPWQWKKVGLELA
ncbi:unnamed protein product [Acanthoscelides obtectus]|uniref:DDE Tnp4 domain-containing protein n=1 Tax=Acanthoscelides obtectus TaxID=200917 RepID=A0A9P0JGL5_ACAOB|nr:unnamed protein product [Acanthoscelides obtectus]CAK1649910.1 Protein ANTAGONIST OF LIKE HETEROCHROMATIN PROTEIN 1 [Acanthoscelides obtectus]